MNINEQKFEDLVLSSAGRMDLWASAIASLSVNRMVEVGVWKGDFARHILEKCESIESYYMVDPWANLPDWKKPFNVDSQTFDAVYAEALKKTQFASSKVRVLRGRTKEVVEAIPDESLDFAYIDGDHTLRGITIDLISILPKLKNGGLIAGDDLTPDVWQHGAEFEPTMVCPFCIYFAEAMNLPFMALTHNQFLIQKVQDSTFSFTDFTGLFSDISLNRPQKTRRGKPVSGLKRYLRKVLSA